MKALCLQTGDEGVDMKDNAEDEEVIRLLEQLQELKSQRAKEQRKMSDLEEQLANLLQVQKKISTSAIVRSYKCLDEFLRCDGFTNCHRILSNGLVHI
jgi:hypothetical protein